VGGLTGTNKVAHQVSLRNVPEALSHPVHIDGF
jgi:hypothetical protein